MAALGNDTLPHTDSLDVPTSYITLPTSV